MNKLFLLLLPFIALSSYADENKRNDAIKKIITYELGSNPNFKIVTSDFKDNANKHPFDSICIRHGIYAWDGVNDFIDKFAHFVALFPPGTTDFTLDKLDADNLESYEPSIKAMRNSLNKYRNLISIVEQYKPYRTRRIYQDYMVKNGNGEDKRYRAFYFFNEDDDLERYFWFDKFKLDGVYTMLLYAQNHSFKIIEDLLSKAGYQLNPKLMTYILNEKEIEFDTQELELYKKTLRKRLKLQSARTNKETEDRNYPQISSVTTQIQIQEEKYNKTDNKYLYNFKGEKYKVIKSVCGATYTKEAMNKFTKYAVTNNTDMINYMLATRELISIKKDEVVIMVEKGFLISRVMLPNGSIVFTDTENLTKL